MACIIKLRKMHTEYKQALFSAPLDCVYLGNPKCACTTIQRVLWTNASPKGTPNFSYADNRQSRDKWRLSRTKETLKELSAAPFVFSFIRNPFARIYSAYYDKVHLARQNKWLTLKVLVDKFGADTNVSFLEFLKWVAETDDVQRNTHWRSQKYQLLTGVVVPDFIGCVEKINDDLQHVQDVLSSRTPAEFIRRCPIENLNSQNSSETILQAYGRKEKDLVLKIYREDFKLLGYSTDILNWKLPPQSSRQIRHKKA